MRKTRGHDAIDALIAAELTPAVSRERFPGPTPELRQNPALSG
jgi:hypothetical protein